MKTFESYQQDDAHIDWDDKHLQVLGEIETEITSEVDGFLQDWPKLPGSMTRESLIALNHDWKNFIEKRRHDWEGRVEPFLKNSRYWRAIREGRNPLRAVGSVTHTLDIFFKSYIKMPSGLSYEEIVRRYLEEKPAMAVDVYVPEYFSPESKRNIESIATVGNMGLF